jgi:iron complex outermembrane recepter protein
MMKWLFASAALLCILAKPAAAQRADENAQAQAGDAFGFSLGGESIGIYNSDSVRGFSPSAAGNVRIDGLYFDQAAGLTDRVQDSSTIRVGLAALDYDFPAPSGIVDLGLRTAGDKPVTSLRFGIEYYGSPFLELDQSFGRKDSVLSGTLGFGLYPDDNGETGNDSSFALIGGALQWRPSESLRVTSFASREWGWSDDDRAVFFTAGSFLPPKIERRRDITPSWTKGKFNTSNVGTTLTWQAGKNLELKAGGFFSRFDSQREFDPLYAGVTQAGASTLRVFVSAPSRYTSWSGDMRGTWTTQTGPVRHRITASVRGRSSPSRFGGDLDPRTELVQLGARPTLSETSLSFTDADLDEDSVKQITAGLSYRADWRGVGLLSLGVQKTDYQKSFSTLGGNGQRISTENSSSPWLFNGAIGVQAGPDLIIYASYTRGLEETGTAPTTAINANEPLPAARTTQREFGVRWAIAPEWTLVTSAYDLRRPFAGLDNANVFSLIGERRHRGIEFSLIAKPIEGLRIIAGGNFMEARLRAPNLAARGLGRKPIGVPNRFVQTTIFYDLPWVAGWSVDSTISYAGERIAKRDNSLNIPARTSVSLGTRYRFAAHDVPVTARLQVNSLTNVYGWNVGGNESYSYTSPRTVRLTLTADL